MYVFLASCLRCFMVWGSYLIKKLVWPFVKAHCNMFLSVGTVRRLPVLSAPFRGWANLGILHSVQHLLEGLHRAPCDRDSTCVILMPWNLLEALCSPTWLLRTRLVSETWRDTMEELLDKMLRRKIPLLLRTSFTMFTYWFPQLNISFCFWPDSMQWRKHLLFP